MSFTAAKRHHSKIGSQLRGKEDIYSTFEQGRRNLGTAIKNLTETGDSFPLCSRGPGAPVSEMKRIWILKRCSL